MSSQAKAPKEKAKYSKIGCLAWAIRKLWRMDTASLNSQNRKENLPVSSTLRLALFALSLKYCSRTMVVYTI